MVNSPISLFGYSEGFCLSEIFRRVFLAREVGVGGWVLFEGRNRGGGGVGVFARRGSRFRSGRVKSSARCSLVVFLLSRLFVCSKNKTKSRVYGDFSLPEFSYFCVLFTSEIFLAREGVWGLGTFEGRKSGGVMEPKSLLRGSRCLRSGRESVSSLGEGVGVFAREGGSRSSLVEGKVFGEELVLCPALVKNNSVLP